jgi:putative transposase
MWSRPDDCGYRLVGILLLNEHGRTTTSCYTSRQFADLFATYTKAFNKAYGRTGSLFAKPFRRRRADSDGYFRTLVVYIHQNPQRHDFVSNFCDWPYSSYAAIASRSNTRVQRTAVLAWFDNRDT